MTAKTKLDSTKDIPASKSRKTSSKKKGAILTTESGLNVKNKNSVPAKKRISPKSKKENTSTASNILSENAQADQQNSISDDETPLGKIFSQSEYFLKNFSEDIAKYDIDFLRKELDLLKKDDRIIAENANSKKERTLKIAIVGAFSCGKSSFLNSILEDEVAPAANKPMTHSITSFFYGEKESYEADGKAISREEYQKAAQDPKTKTEHFIVHYPCERLKSLEFMDSPGFGSVSPGDDISEETAENDNALSEKAVKEADVVFFLTILGDGIIAKDSFELLEKICQGTKNANNPHQRIYVVLNKSDVKTPQERETVEKYIINQCEKAALKISDYFLYCSKMDKFTQMDDDSLPAMFEFMDEEMKKEWQKDQEEKKKFWQEEKKFYESSRDCLFETVHVLQEIGQRLIAHRVGYNAATFKIQTSQYLRKIKWLSEFVRSNISKEKKKYQRKLTDNLKELTYSAAEIVYDVFETKYSENRNSLLHDEKKMFGDDTISLLYQGDLATLSDGEIFQIKRNIITSSENLEIPLEEACDTVLNEIFSSEIVSSDQNPSDAYSEIVLYPNSGKFHSNSLADYFLQTCVSIFDQIGGPWYENLWGQEERDKFINKKLKIIDEKFKENFFSEIYWFFSEKGFHKIVHDKVVVPLANKIAEPVTHLIELEKNIDSVIEQIGGDKTPLKANIKGENRKNRPEISVDDLWNSLEGMEQKSVSEKNKNNEIENENLSLDNFIDKL